MATTETESFTTMMYKNFGRLRGIRNDLAEGDAMRVRLEDCLESMEECFDTYIGTIDKLYRYWTEAECRQLRELHVAGVKVEEIARRIERPLSSVVARITQYQDEGLLVLRKKKWTETEIQTITRMCDGGCPVTEIAKTVGRAYPTVASKIRQLQSMGRIKGPPKRVHITWTAEDDHTLIVGLVAGDSRAELIKKLGRTYNAISLRIKRLRAAGKIEKVKRGKA